MNRPNIKNDPNYPFEFPDTYLGKLEEYCDYVENTLESVTQTMNLLKEDNDMLAEDNFALEQALDKACALLTYDQFNAIPPKELLNFCMKDWKEWLMKDDNTND